MNFKVILLFIIGIVFSVSVYAKNVKINMIGNPKWNNELFSTYKQIEKIKQDSTTIYYNIVAGDIFDKSINDSLYKIKIDSLENSFIIPSDFSFDFNLKNLLVTNAKSDSINIFNSIILGDSIKVGIIAILTPDLAVKNNYKNIIIESRIKPIIKKYLNILKKKSDKTVLISNISKNIIKKLTKDEKIDFIIGFDYVFSKNSIFNNKIEFIYLNKEYILEFHNN